MVEWLKAKAWSSSPSTTKKKKKTMSTVQAATAINFTTVSNHLGLETTLYRLGGIFFKVFSFSSQELKA
jgi:hypothetical protein